MLNEGDRCVTPGGLPGQVVAVEHNGYQVTLDRGLGGGFFAAREVQPLPHAEAVVDHTAADDYPELGAILSDRPDYAHSVPADTYYGGSVRVSKLASSRFEDPCQCCQGAGEHHDTGKECYRCDASGKAEGPEVDESVPCDGAKQDKEALYLPLNDGISPQPGQGSSSAYQDGFRDAVARSTRQPRSADGAYRNDYDLGWAEGVKSAPPQPEIPTTDADQLDDRLSQKRNPVVATVAGLWDFIKGDPKPVGNWKGEGSNWSYDWCFPPEAPVLLSDATERPISEMRIGDRVVTHTGSIKSVTWVGSRPYSGELVSVEAHGDRTRTLRATPEHRVWAWSVGDDLPGWHELGSLRPGDLLSRSVLSDERSLSVQLHQPEHFFAKYRQPIELKVDEQLAWVLGYYTGDGFPAASRGFGVAFAVHEDDAETMQRLRSVSETLEGKLSIYPERDTKARRVIITSQSLYLLCVTLVGRGARTKRLDGRLLTLGLSEQRAFVQGYQQADGSKTSSGRNVIDSVGVMPVQVREMLSRLGVVSNLRRRVSNGFGLNSPSTRLEWWGGKYSLKRHFIKDGQVWAAIRSTRREQYDGDVWDIEVEDDHSFRAYGFNVHNCRFRKNSHCFYPKGLDEAATKQAGYSVWIPEDRGNCPRVKWDMQKLCPVAEPGPHSGSVNAQPDATVSWENGGQRPLGRASSVKEAVLDPEMGFHLTASWSDVRSKAKRIRAEGGVRIVAVREGIITAEVKGDLHTYQTTVTRVPGKQAVGFWECACPWGSYSWGRSGRWKKYEGRMCSHALATTFEAQSRGAHGREVNEDAKTPDWARSVYVPGDYSRDKQAYSSLRIAAYADDEHDVPPMAEFAAGLLGNGNRPHQVMAVLEQVSATNVAAPLVALALRSGFRAKVRGIIMRLFITDDGKLIDDHGGSVAYDQVLYPTYDPHLGLNVNDRGRFLMSSREALRVILSINSTNPEVYRAAAKAVLTLSQRNEPKVTQMLQGLVGNASGKLEGLDYRLKGIDSLQRKIEADSPIWHNGDVGKAAAGIHDGLRYTVVLPSEGYTQNVQKILGEVQKAGHTPGRVKNFWETGGPYKGINSVFRAPGGHPWELQFHTPESLNVKETGIHPLYEEYRTIKPDSDENRSKLKQLESQMIDMIGKVQNPQNVGSIGTPKGGPVYAILAGAFDGSSDHPYRYWSMNSPMSDKPLGVFREYTGEDSHHVEIWDKQSGSWKLTPEAYRNVVLGDPRIEDITEDEANKLIKQLGGKIASMAEDEHWLFLKAAAARDEDPTEEYAEHVVHQLMPGTNQRYPYDKPWYDPSRWGRDGAVDPDHEAEKARRRSAADEQWGLTFGEPSYDRYPFAWEGPNGGPGLGEVPAPYGIDPDPLMHGGVVQEHPAALPEAYGDDEDAARTAIMHALGMAPAAPVPPTTDQQAMAMGLQDDVSEAREDLGLPPLHSMTVRTVADVLDRHKARLAGVDAGDSDPFAHLKSGPASPDVADAAKAFLQRTALKDFSPGERASIIEEGVGVTAGNIDMLNITGTHYEALEARLQQEGDSTADDTIWWG